MSKMLFGTNYYMEMISLNMHTSWQLYVSHCKIQKTMVSFLLCVSFGSDEFDSVCMTV